MNVRIVGPGERVPSGHQGSPEVDALAEPRRTDPRGPLIDSVTNLRNAVLPVAVLIFTREADTAFIVGAIAAAVLIPISLIFSYLAWSRLTFRIGEHDIRVESGLISRTARSVPYERIQDIAFEEKPLARVLGLVALTFETGAGAGEDLKLSYLSRKDAQALRNEVRDQLRDSLRERGERGDRHDGPAERETQAIQTERALFALSPSRVLILGVFNFSLIAIPLAGGVLAQLEDVLPFDFWDIDGWRERLAGPGAMLAGMGVAAQAIGVGVLALALMLVGIATGMVRTALREWGFHLTRTANGLKRVRGLFTRTMAVLPVRRVQAAIVSTGIVRARLGWQELSLVSLAADSGGANHAIAPLAREYEVRALIEEVGLEMPDAVEWQRIDPRYIAWRTILAARFWIVVAGIVATIQFQFALPAPFMADAWWIAAIALALAKALRTMRALQRTRYALTDTYLFKRSGWLSPVLYIVPRQKLNGAALYCGPVERRLDLAELVVGLAGASLSVPGLASPRARSLLQDLLESMKRRDFASVN